MRLCTPFTRIKRKQSGLEQKAEEFAVCLTVASLVEKGPPCSIDPIQICAVPSSHGLPTCAVRAPGSMNEIEHAGTVATTRFGCIRVKRGGLVEIWAASGASAPIAAREAGGAFVFHAAAHWSRVGRGPPVGAGPALLLKSRARHICIFDRVEHAQQMLTFAKYNLRGTACMVLLGVLQ